MVTIFASRNVIAALFVIGAMQNRNTSHQLEILDVRREHLPHRRFAARAINHAILQFTIGEFDQNAIANFFPWLTL